MGKLNVCRVPPGTIQDYGKETSRRCHYCNARFIGAKRLAKLPGMTSPFCYRHLDETADLFKGDTYRLEETE